MKIDRSTTPAILPSEQNAAPASGTPQGAPKAQRAQVAQSDGQATQQRWTSFQGDVSASQATLDAAAAPTTDAPSQKPRDFAPSLFGGAVFNSIGVEANPTWRQVTDDPANANDNRNMELSFQQIHGLRGAVNARLRSMSSTQAEQFREVDRVMGQDAHARLAWQQMLLDGRLTDGPTNTEGASLLDAVSQMAQQPLAAGLERPSLLADMVQEVANPSSINQGNFNTCGATSASAYLAMHNPAEYVRLTAGLASPGGRIAIANGDTISREADVIGLAGDGRTQSNRLLASAFMEYGSDLDYNASEDRQGIGGISLFPGLPTAAAEKLLEGITNRSFRKIRFWGSVEHQLGRIQERVEAGEVVPSLLRFGESRSNILSQHYVNVTDVTDTTVSYVNPWGMEEVMTKAEFLSRAEAALLPE